MFTKLKVPKDIYFINFGGCDHNISTLYIDIYIYIYNVQIQFFFVWMKTKNCAVLIVKFLLPLLIPIQCQDITI